MDLIDYMKKYSITQKKMARRLKITECHLRRIIFGTSHPSRKLAELIEEKTKGMVTKEEAIFFETHEGEIDG